MRKFKPLVLAALIATIATSAYAISEVPQAATGSNDVYIEQIGNSNIIEIEQIGGTNKVGGTDSTTPSSTNYASITGSSNQVTVKQFGDNNLNQYKIIGDSNRYTSVVTGYDNVNKLTIGTSNAAVNLRNVVTDTVTGDTNRIVQGIVGSDNTSVVTISGNRNDITRVIRTNSADSTITLSGNDNQVYSEQVDPAGGVGHSLVLGTTGSYNTYAIQQQGTNDTNVNISTLGSHNAVTVRTSSSTITAPVTAVAR